MLDHDIDLVAQEAWADQVETGSRMIFLQDAGVFPRTGGNAFEQSSIGYILNQAGAQRSVVIYEPDMSEYTDAAYVASSSVYEGGTVAWSNYQLTGAPKTKSVDGTPLTASDYSALAANNINFLQNQGGVWVVREGKAIGGEWIDIIRGRDLLEDNITVAARNYLLSKKGSKVPYTQAGMQESAGVVDGELQRAVASGFLTAYTVTVPDRADVPLTNVAARFFDGITFEGTLAGAITTISVSGTLSY